MMALLFYFQSKEYLKVFLMSHALKKKARYLKIGRKIEQRRRELLGNTLMHWLILHTV